MDIQEIQQLENLLHKGSLTEDELNVALQGTANLIAKVRAQANIITGLERDRNFYRDNYDKTNAQAADRIVELEQRIKKLKA